MATFGELKIGDRFEVYGDIHINYDYPKICVCEKVSEEYGAEVNGCSFPMNPEDEVFETTFDDGI